MKSIGKFAENIWKLEKKDPEKFMIGRCSQSSNQIESLQVNEMHREKRVQKCQKPTFLSENMRKREKE